MENTVVIFTKIHKEGSMNSKRLRLFTGVFALTAALLFGAGSSDDASDRKGTIGFSVFDMQYGFFQQMEKGTKDGVTDLGYNYILHDQKSDEGLMVSGVMDLINQGIDALIISPIKPEAMGPIVAAAQAKGIPVIVDDIGGGGTDYDVLVVSDNYGGGVMAAEYAVKTLGSGGSMEAATIAVDPSHVYAFRRTEGFRDAMVDANWKVVKELNGHDKTEEGYTVMQDIITANPDVQVVFCGNDPMAVGAAQAAADAGRNDIMIVGFNADEIALEAIKAGSMEATVQQVPYRMGKMTAELADRLLKGETLEFDDDPNRELWIEVNLITLDNVDEALAELK
ncbi:MAG: hypothetical protein DRZ90_13560 [Spirochaetes bacterium]|nr:MAG: hypothetical protein DRZ90_13560 [Spirochaetota bacterium]